MIFIKNKYCNWYYGIIQNAKSQPRIKSKTKYFEKHHILPVSLDGDNSNENLVLLTAREHFICHYLLCKMLPENSDPWHSMVKAFNMMKGSSKSHNNNRYFNSYLYEYARKNLSASLSQSQTGNKNSNYGKYQATHPHTNKRKMIKNELIEEYIGQGWYGPSSGYQPVLSWEKQIINKCHFCGETIKDCICGLQNCNLYTVKNLQKCFNLNISNLGTPAFVNDLEIMKKYAWEEYTTNSTTKLGKKTGVNPQTISNLIKRLGFPLKMESKNSE